MDTQQTLTRREVASTFKVSQKTVERWEKAGILPAVRIGASVRYRVEDVETLRKDGRAAS